MRRRLRIDPIACDGFGYCAELVPELVRLDEWGFPVVRDLPIPEGVEAMAAEAAAQCPRRAVYLQLEAVGNQRDVPSRPR
jgi:ferredoxin